MKLIIQIPCFNEEESLAKTIGDLPKTISGIDEIAVLLIDDGSSDRSVEIARSLGVPHILKLKAHMGLARAFAAGIERCLELGADIIVTTDGDNQYAGQEIEKLAEPILQGRADVVIGDRPIASMEQFSWIKKRLQSIGSWIVRHLADCQVKDVISGFRAYSRHAALHISILTDYSYTIENLIQLGYQKMKIVSVPVTIHPTRRKSRLMKNVPHFLLQQGATIIRVYATYTPLKFFLIVGFFFTVPGIIGLLRYGYFAVRNQSQGHAVSLVFSLLFLLCGFMIFLIGVVADLIANNRKLAERTLVKMKKTELEKRTERGRHPPDEYDH
jgi:glycosyltransferase involved in cell wall biosynthesis